jgi:hypothetical protein
MSSRRRSGLSEGKSALSLDGAPQLVLADRLGDDIDRPADDCRQAVPKGVKAANTR